MLNIHEQLRMKPRIENGWMEGPVLKIYAQAKCEEVVHLRIHTSSDLFKAASNRRRSN